MEGWMLLDGYPALFLLSFLASTLIPLGSEWFLGLLLLNGMNTGLILAVATLGNTLGAMTTYAIGLRSGPFLGRHLLRISPSSQLRARTYCDRYGSWVLLFSWVPFLGDALCFAGGILRINFWRFTVLVAIGKLSRYLFVAYAIKHVMDQTMM